METICYIYQPNKYQFSLLYVLNYQIERQGVAHHHDLSEPLLFL